jgi:hypothetical protein
LYGKRAARGMAPFADRIGVPEAEAIHAYLIDTAKPLLAH